MRRSHSIVNEPLPNQEELRERWTRMGMLRLAAIVAVLSAPGVGFAQPPAVVKVDEAKLKEIAARADKLALKIADLRRKNVRDPQLAEIEVFAKAVDWAVRHNEFYHKDSGDWALEALDAGLIRAGQAGQGEVPWMQETGHAVVRAYRSQIDGSVQPYAVTYPADYGKQADKRWRVDVVLHGRDAVITEIKFLHEHNGTRAAPKDQDFVKIDIFGRGNNAYRWAGEMDVLEAEDNFLAVERLLGRDLRINRGRIILRGFSMGGAGTWHLGLHHPDRWCVLGPGAGFTTTHGYVKDMPEKLPPYQEPCLRIYDAIDYAENAFHVPIVAYGGTNDPQLQAARNIEARLKPLGIPMTLLVAPDEAHRMPPEWQRRAEEKYASLSAKGRAEYPSHVRFVTYTLRYAHCEWVHLLGLDRHYERTFVEGTSNENGFNLKTVNVRALSLDLPPGSSRQNVIVAIDGQRLETRPYLNSVSGTLHVYLQRREGQWHIVLPEKLLTDATRHMQKTENLQGPIDDAFMGPFLCVVGTGEPWNPVVHKYAEDSLKRFQQEWDKFLRGELPVKKDADITPEDLVNRHLILFGDPASNSLIGQALDTLPLKWTKEQITLGGKRYSSAEHVPALIYPSPFTPRRYVVINSGHTFHAAEFNGTNALLYPRLGDYAVLKLAPTSKDPLATNVAEAGIFDDAWQLPR